MVNHLGRNRLTLDVPYKGLSSIEPDESGGQVNAGQETLRGLVVASGNGPELLELGKEVLDEVARLVEAFVEGARRLAGCARWDHRRLAGFSERLERALVRIERFVGNERLGFKLWEQGIGSGQIMLLTAGEMKAGRMAERIDGGVNFGAQPSARAPDGLILTAFLRAPALCWWARTMVESIIAYSLSASSDRWLKTLSQTPLFAHRVNRVWIVSGSPNRSGKSRHGMPAR